MLESQAAPSYVPAPAVCGVARWSIKTAADAAAASLDTKAVAPTVVGLGRLPAPAAIVNKLPRQARFGGVEFKTFRVKVRLVGFKLSDDDSDIHLVVRAPQAKATLIAEFPLAGCVAKSASVANRRKMTAARRALLKACAEVTLTQSLKPLRGTATITGVGFIDFSHNQTGHADNYLELHPLLSLARFKP